MVAEEIEVMLVRRRMNKSGLARKLGVSHTWVTNRLSGQQEIGLNELQRIAEVLEVDITDLLPRPTEGRVLTTIGSHPSTPNAGSGRPAVRGTRTRSTRRNRPIGGARKDATAPASADAVTQRRPMLVSAPGQRIAA